ncbi:hypothetical protein [Shewanella sp. 10N.286.48.A6]|nr:hypothetical protein [Shewanella sp. 10N.286.48.A6]
MNKNEIKIVTGGLPVAPIIVATVAADLGLIAAFSTWYYAKTA